MLLNLAASSLQSKFKHIIFAPLSFYLCSHRDTYVRWSLRNRCASEVPSLLFYLALDYFESSHKSDISYPTIPLFLHACATCSKLLSYINAMGGPKNWVDWDELDHFMRPFLIIRKPNFATFLIPRFRGFLWPIWELLTEIALKLGRRRGQFSYRLL